MEVEVNNKKPNSLILRLVVNTLSVFVVAKILPGIEITDITAAIVVAILLAILNATLKPLLILLTLPITILSLGFFLLIINAFVILTVENWVDSFHVAGFWWAILFSFLLSVVNSFLYSLGSSPKNY